MKEIQLNNTHIALGAKMVSFSGYKMPLQYGSVIEEHHAVRNGVGVFDVSHMGEFLVSGPNALALIQKVTSNDVATLTIGQAQYTCFPNENNGIVDDLIIYRIKEAQYLLVVNASNIEKDWEHISSYNKDFNADLKNLSSSYSLLAIQGPKTIAAIQSLSSIDLNTIKPYHFRVSDFAGVEYVIISATGYTGAGGFEIYCKNSEVEQVWNAIFKAGATHDIRPIGLAARDTLRMEMGYCLYGNDIDDRTSPIEAGLGWITKFNKDFVNSKNLLEQKKNGTDRRLVAFVMQELGIPRKGYPILDTEGNTIGNVTSGTQSPTLSKGIGMGYVTIDNAKANHPINIRIRNKVIKAIVTRPPLIKIYSLNS